MAAFRILSKFKPLETHDVSVRNEKKNKTKQNCECNAAFQFQQFYLRSPAVHAKFQTYMPFSTFFISVDTIKCNENPCVNYV